MDTSIISEIKDENQKQVDALVQEHGGIFACNNKQFLAGGGDPKKTYQRVASGLYFEKGKAKPFVDAFAVLTKKLDARLLAHRRELIWYELSNFEAMYDREGAVERINDEYGIPVDEVIGEYNQWIETVEV